MNFRMCARQSAAAILQDVVSLTLEEVLVDLAAVLLGNEHLV